MNMLVTGPSQSGKSTLVSQLLLRMPDMISVDFEYIVLFIGTAAKDNAIATTIGKMYGNSLTVVEVNKLYGGDKSMFKHKFPTDFFSYLNKEKNGCVIFDDLMTELADCDVLVNSFTKTTSKWNLSMIHLTQNLFFRGSGKHSGDNSTVYRNSHYIVLFRSPVDSTMMNIVAKRISGAAYARTASMFHQIATKYRYILIDGRLDTPDELRFRSDIFGLKNGNIPYMRTFQLAAAEEKNHKKS